MGARRKGREIALQMLYQWDLDKKSVDALVASHVALTDAGEEAKQFARSLVRGTLARIEDIDERIASRTEGWRLSRIAVVDRNILRVAVYELLETDTPPSVVINEALEVAKRYASPDTVGFVNGILDSIGTDLKEASEKSS